jgi:hypothetical protein
MRFEMSLDLLFQIVGPLAQLGDVLALKSNRQFVRANMMLTDGDFGLSNEGEREVVPIRRRPSKQRVESFFGEIRRKAAAAG